MNTENRVESIPKIVLSSNIPIRQILLALGIDSSDENIERFLKKAMSMVNDEEEARLVWVQSFDTVLKKEAYERYLDIVTQRLQKELAKVETEKQAKNIWMKTPPGTSIHYRAREKYFYLKNQNLQQELAEAATVSEIISVWEKAIPDSPVRREAILKLASFYISHMQTT